MRFKNFILLLLLFFTLIYASIGDPDNIYWSGAYFLVNYIVLFTMFSRERDNKVSYTGMALSISIFIYVVLKYFFNIEIQRIFTLILFVFSLISIIYIEKKWRT